MALGGPVVRQHYVEFIRGTGVKLDGVVDGTSTNGPWTWVVPKDVSVIFVTGVGAGGGGGSSTSATPSSRGGGGGASGVGCAFLECPVAPGKSLTVTVGAKGAAVTAGGASTITNLVSSPLDNTTTLDLKGGLAGSTGSSSGGAGGTSGYGMGAGSSGGANAATPPASPTNNINYISLTSKVYVAACGGSTGGPASTSGSTDGSAGGVNPATMWLHSGFMQAPTAGAGDNTGTISRGGGGVGGFSLIGYGGNGGNAATNGGNATGYGAGGGGAGGGGATGGSGSDGYIGIFYWSAD